MKYLCLAYEEQAKLDGLAPEEWAALREETLSYVTAQRERGALLAAYPLRSAATATVVRVRDGRTAITDGPFAETKEQLGGYFLIDVPDLDEALRIAAGWPSARIGAIEVRPVEDTLPRDKRYR